MKEKKRLDVLMTELGLAPSRERAQRLVMAGLVYVNGQKALKPGMSLSPDAAISVREENDIPFVSRGGLKLQKAVEVFNLQLGGVTAMDVGASTGGFTDCMLQNGAAKVYAIDVGYGQLAWKLREDPRVVALERTNIRYIDRSLIAAPVDFACVDVSFISLRLVLPVVHDLLRSGGDCVCLIKPQFEAGRDRVGKKGVVRDPAVHADVLRTVTGFAGAMGFTPLGLDFSPVKGPQGNIEYLMYLRRGSDTPGLEADSIDALVASAHRQLSGGDAPDEYSDHPARV